MTFPLAPDTICGHLSTAVEWERKKQGVKAGGEGELGGVARELSGLRELEEIGTKWGGQAHSA